MEWEFEKERLGKSIVRDLYEHEFIKTIYSNEDNVEGWTLKSGIWSPVYINLRPVGSVSEIFEEISYGLDRLIHYEAPKTTILVGIEMAGIPLAVGASLELRHTLPTRGFPFAYTRSLPGKKVRTVEEAKTALAQLDRVHDYGGHSLVEGHFENGDVICLVDDMTTNIESKLISREIIKHELKSRGIEEYSCNDVAVLLDREQGAQEQAKKHGINLMSLIKFKTNGLEWLEEKMNPQEHSLIKDYLANTQKYQDADLISAEREKAKNFFE